VVVIDDSSSGCISYDIKELIQKEIHDSDKRQELKLAALREEFHKFEATNNARLGLMNEIRDQLREQALSFITRNELKLIIDALIKDDKSLSDRVWILFTSIFIGMLILTIGLIVEYGHNSL